MALLGGLMAACQPVDFGGVTSPTGGTTNGGDSATLSVTNNVTRDPGAFTLLLYASNVVDITAPSTTVGSVPENATVSFKIPAGQWKLAIQDETGTVWPMLADVGSTDWTIVQAGADTSYVLILSTDSGDNDVWTSNLTIVQ